jgi:hypothetical protein
MKKLLAICAVLFLALGAANLLVAQTPASDATGSWSGQMQGPNGDMTITFHLKQDEAKLTGSVETGMGDPIEIQNGKIDGEKIYWETSFNGMTIQHDGTISGDEIKINVKSSDGQFPATDMTLKRDKQ